MSRTACWATNDINVETCEYYVGYGSRWDMIHGHPFHIGLEGMKTLFRFDYNFYRGIMWEYKCYRNPLPLTIIEEIQNHLFYTTTTLKDEITGEKRIREIVNQYVSIEDQYNYSPCQIRFPGERTNENKKKELEWFEQCMPESGKYGRPKFHIERESDTGWGCTHADGKTYLYEHIGPPMKYPDSAMMKRMQDMLHIVNENSYGIKDLRSTEAYLCGKIHVRNNYGKFEPWEYRTQAQVDEECRKSFLELFGDIPKTDLF